MNDFVIERDQSTDEKVRRELTDAEQAIADAKRIPSTDPNDYTLTPTQWRWMVRSAGLWDHIDTAKASLKASNLAAWADLMGTLEGSVFKFQPTLEQIASFQPLLVGVTLPDEAALTPLWLGAAAR